MKSLNKYKEKILLFRIRTLGDKKAYGELYDNYTVSIYRFIFFKVSSVEEAEDLTSETFLKTWNYLIDQEKASKIDAFRPFIYKVARNLVIDYYRQRVEEVSLEGNQIDKTDESKDIRLKVELDKQLEDIEKGLRQLKEEYREVIILKYIEDLNTSEIAEIIGKSKNTTRVLAHRAIKALKEITKE